MKKLLIILAVIVVLLVALVFIFMRGPGMKQYEHLKEPQIVELEQLQPDCP